MKRFKHTQLTRGLYKIGGFSLIAAGCVLTATPLPMGLIMIATGTAAVIPVSAKARRIVRASRRHFSLWDKALGRVALIAPERMGRILTMTAPRKSKIMEQI